MPYGRLAGEAGRLAQNVIGRSPLGGAVRAVTSLLGGKPADRAASLRLRELGKRALGGDQAARSRIIEMATRQGSKFATINAAARRYAAKLGYDGSMTLGAGPIGIMAPGGGTVNRVSSTRRRRRKSGGRRRSRSTRSGYVLYKGRRYTRAQARIFVPAHRR